MEDTRTTVEQFIEREGLTFTVEPANENPHMLDMPRGSSHWLVTIRKGDESMSVSYSMGPAHTDEPDPADVLDCIASDSASYENAQSFDDWATEMGFFPMESSEDYRTAQDTWSAVERQHHELEALLGNEAFQALLWDTERR